MSACVSALGVYSSVRCDGGGISGAIEKLNSQFKYLVTSVECEYAINYGSSSLNILYSWIYMKSNNTKIQANIFIIWIQIMFLPWTKRLEMILEFWEIA